jgi:CDP-diacylglycerol---glycerol-3-phosphate 3-phosphatidyltransferase
MKNNTEILSQSTLPNKLTALRVACIPLVVFFLSYSESGCDFISLSNKWCSFFGALFIGMAFITDILDGYYARKYQAVTTLGKFLDPLADKVLVTITMIMLIPLGRIPELVVIIIIAREMAVTGLRSIAAEKGIVIQAERLGKLKTIFQAVAILGLSLHYEYLYVDFHMVGMAFLWAALVLTVWSGWSYFNHFRKVF